MHLVRALRPLKLTNLIGTCILALIDRSKCRYIQFKSTCNLGWPLFQIGMLARWHRWNGWRSIHLDLSKKCHTGHRQIIWSHQNAPGRCAPYLFCAKYLLEQNVKIVSLVRLAKNESSNKAGLRGCTKLFTIRPFNQLFQVICFFPNFRWVLVLLKILFKNNNRNFYPLFMAFDVKMC